MNDDHDLSAQPSVPCAMVVFGAGGDLTKRKLIPALYNLAREGLLPKEFAVVGFGRTPLETATFRQKIAQDLRSFATNPVEASLLDPLLERLYYQIGNLQDAAAYEQLGALLAEVDERHGTGGNYLHYLATAPEYFGEAARRLGAAGLTQEANGRWRRVIIEKPFGRDLASARALNRELQQVLEEHQIYRIDHYLGKETVQNILAFRFGNGIFEPIWNGRYIDHVQITVAETVGVETRGGYYDQSGALRDMVPNHIFQLITLTAMEPPNSFEADAVRDEQTKLLRAIPPLSETEVLTRAVRGQYGEGAGDGGALPAYQAELRVEPGSTTETFVALKLPIDNWRWADVPFYLRTGKRLARHTSEIVIQFKRVPFMLFRKTAVERLTPNRLVLHIQPEEGIALQFGAKVPGPTVKLGPVEMAFRYEDYFGREASTGYERLLYDAMIGDPTLFQRAETLEAGWSVVAPILDAWKARPAGDFPNYAAGTWGPREAEELLARDGRQWHETVPGAGSHVPREDGPLRDTQPAAAGTGARRP